MNVTKEGGRYVVTGAIAVVAGRVANEPYRRVHATRRAATVDAETWARINAESLADLAETRAARRTIVRAYLAQRAARRDTGQMPLL